MPCRRWDNFLPTAQKLSFLDPSGNLIAGTYKVQHTCMWRNAGTLTPVPGTTSTSSFTFSVQAGCPTWLDAKLLSLAESMLLSSPQFVTAACADTDQIKEAVFRNLDRDTDGSLKKDELIRSLVQNQADLSYALQLNTSVSLGDFAKARVRPLTCTAPQPQFYSYVPPGRCSPRSMSRAYTSSRDSTFVFTFSGA